MLAMVDMQCTVTVQNNTDMILFISLLVENKELVEVDVNSGFITRAESRNDNTRTQSECVLHYKLIEIMNSSKMCAVIPSKKKMFAYHIAV